MRRDPLCTVSVLAQCILEEREAVGARARLFICLRAHEIADESDVRINLIVGELVETLGDRPDDDNV